MTNAFERHGIGHLSPSSINTFIAAPSLWVLEKLLKFRGGMGCAAHRGTATEVGVSEGLFDHSLTADACTDVALAAYDKITALSGDSRRDAERLPIPGMVAQGLALREHGAPIRPNGNQHKIEVRIEGVSVPVIGYLDWLYPSEIIDLKTTMRVPSEMGETHLRAAAVYKTAHMDKRVRYFYVSDKKAAKHTLTREQYDLAMLQITHAAIRLERFLGLSTDPQELAAVVPHNSESFYFSDPATKARAVEVYGF